jgi:ferredoxin
MTHVVAEACINCKFTDCVAVCPVDCFHEGTNFLVIDPEVCIDCGLCVPECPVEAIFSEDDLPEEWSEYLEINEKYTADWPVIDTQKDPLPTSDEFREVKGKKDLIDPAPFSG